MPTLGLYRNAIAPALAQFDIAPADLSLRPVTRTPTSRAATARARPTHSFAANA